MTSRSISITDEAYNMLKKYQLKKESISQTILRLLRKQENLLSLAGAWQKIEDSEQAIELIEKVVKKVQEEPNEPISPIN
jgi:predicted CopG family antitoxin